MDRREMLQWIGGAVGIHALAGASPERLIAIGRAAHERRQALLVLNAHQNQTVTTIAEHIIPETDTRSQCGPCQRVHRPVTCRVE